MRNTNRSKSTIKTLLLLGSLTAIPAAPLAAQEAEARIDELFSSIKAEDPGCAAGAVKDGRLIAMRAYGVADLETAAPIGPDTKFDIGSTHKQFVATAILLLEQDGTLSLTDDIRRFFPEMPTYQGVVTVDHLLTHTSGIRDWTGLLPLAPEGTQAIDLILRQSALNFAPGTSWSYSNSGYVLLKEIVRRASGMTFAEFARKRIFEPLGMHSSEYVEDAMQAEGKVAKAYRQTPQGWEQYMRLGEDRGGGGVVSTIEDLLVWNAALRDMALGAQVTGKLEQRTRLANGHEVDYARGLIVKDLPDERLISHSGGAAGYSTWLGRFTRNDLSVAVMCNFEPVSASKLAADLAELFLPPVDPEVEEPLPETVEGVDLVPFAGTYRSPDSGEILRLMEREGRIRIVGGPELVAVGETRLQPLRTELFFRSQQKIELAFTTADRLQLTSGDEVTHFERLAPWSPAADDLAAFEGRFTSDDTGRVWEILADADGLIFRFEDRPDQTVPAEPVARDLFAQRGVLVQFRRNENGEVTGFDYSNPLIENLVFRKLCARLPETPDLAIEAPATPGPDDAAIPDFNLLTGTYALAPGRTIAITLEDGELFGQPAGSAKRRLYSLGGAEFGVGAVDSPMRVRFMIETVGAPAKAIVLIRNGNEAIFERTD